MIKKKKYLEIRMPDYLREDILKFIRLRNIGKEDETTINIVHLKIQFEYLMS